MNRNGVVLYDGPSRIDGERIVVILTGLNDSSENRKTGMMLQTWILRADRKPTEARQAGVDYSVCGDCPHRAGSCYVNLGQGPRAIWTCWAYGKGYAPYDPAKHDRLIAGRPLRLGSYGDPSAVPVEVFAPLLEVAGKWTGYTHQWDKPIGAAYKPYCMASVDTDEEARAAARAGWRYFQVVPKSVEPAGALRCPASEEAGKQTQCERCGLCNGLSGSNRPSVFINVHGSIAHISIYNKVEFA